MGVLNTTKKSTGGGGGGGGDRYLGTMGPLVDVPSGNKYPNFLSFPAANKGEWVKVTKNLTIAGKPVKEGEEWVCNTNGTAIETPANWELRAKRTKKFLSEVQYIRRSVYFSTPSITLKPHVEYFIRFPQSDDLIYGSSTVPKDELNLDMSGVFSYSENLRYTIYVNAEFSPDSSGTRRVFVRSLEYFPLYDMGEKNANGSLKLGDRLDAEGGTDNKLLTYKDVEATKEGRHTFMESSAPLTDLIFYGFFQTIFSVGILHTGDVPIGLKSAAFELVAYED